MTTSRSSKANRSILVPLDGSPLAEAALPHALALAQATSSGLTLLQVVQSFAPAPYLGSLPEASPEAFEVYEEAVACAQSYLQGLARRLGSDGTTIETRVVDGDPVDSILVCAQDPTAHVSSIVMCTFGWRGAGRLLFGRVAGKLLRTSPVPLLIVHRDLELSLNTQRVPWAVPHYKTLLVPVDGSPPAEQALYEATDLARNLGARLVLLSVVTAPLDLKIVKQGGSAGWLAVGSHGPAEQTVEYLDRITQELASAGLCVEAQVVHGEIVSEVLDAAKSVDADMIAMATGMHVHGGPGHPGHPGPLMTGTVAERVVQLARLPVLLIPSQGQPDASQG